MAFYGDSITRLGGGVLRVAAQYRELFPERDVRFFNAFAKFAATDADGRSHNLVDYAHACRANPDADEFELFVPCR